MNRLRFAQIGIGGMGAGHLHALRARDDARLMAVCDSNMDLLMPFTEEQEAIATYTDWREVLKRDDLDAAIVVLPHHLYPEVVNAALERGLHVLKEKPLAMNLADGLSMFDTAERTGRTLMVAAQSKFYPSFSEACEFARSGVLGDLFLARGSIIYRWASAFENRWRWRGIKAQSGGVAVIDSGWHLLDLMHWYLGPPVRVFCSLGSRQAIPEGQYDVDERAVLTLDYDTGCVASAVCCYIALPNELKISLHGNTGNLVVDRDTLTTMLGDGTPMHHSLERVDPMAAQLDHFIACVKEGDPPLSSVQEAIHVQRMIEAAYRSAGTHQPVELAEL